MSDLETATEPKQELAPQSDGVESPSEDDDGLSAGAEEFCKVVSGDPALVGSLDDLLRQQLENRALDNRSMQRLSFGFSQLVGSDGSYFLARYLSANEPAKLLEIVPDPQANAILRRLQALFGNAVADALRLYDQDPDEWSDMYRDVKFDVIAQAWVLKFTIEKFNGERLELVMNPSSLMRLAAGVVKTLNFVDVSVFEPEAVQLFTSESSSLFEKLDQLTSKVDSPADSPDKGAEAPADAAEASS